MRTAAAVTIAVLAPALASAQTFDYGLGSVERTVEVEQDGHLLITGVARASLRRDGDVSAVLSIDGEPCARSTNTGEGLVVATTSCLVPVEAGATHTFRLVETDRRGVSRRSSLTVDPVTDPTAINATLGQASGREEASMSILSAAETTVEVIATVDVVFGACEGDDCPSGRAGFGSLEAVYDVGEGWQTCFTHAFNTFAAIPDQKTCSFTLPAGREARVAMTARAAGGATIGRALIGATGPQGDAGM